jgi:hypothetical protein
LIREAQTAVREVLEVRARLVLRVLLVRLVHLVHLVRLEARVVLLVAMVVRHRAVLRRVVPHHLLRAVLRRVVVLLRVVLLHLLLVGLRLLEAPNLHLHLQRAANLRREILLQVAGRVVLHRRCFLRRHPGEVLVLEEATWAGSRLLGMKKRSLRGWPYPSEAPG